MPFILYPDQYEFRGTNEMQFRSPLPDLGSNQDLQIQNLTYYHYTIGQ